MDIEAGAGKQIQMRVKVDLGLCHSLKEPSQITEFFKSSSESCGRRREAVQSLDLGMDSCLECYSSALFNLVEHF